MISPNDILGSWYRTNQNVPPFDAKNSGISVIHFDTNQRFSCFQMQRNHTWGKTEGTFLFDGRLLIQQNNVTGANGAGNFTYRVHRKRSDIWILEETRRCYRLSRSLFSDLESAIASPRSIRGPYRSISDISVDDLIIERMIPNEGPLEIYWNQRSDVVLNHKVYVGSMSVVAVPNYKTIVFIYQHITNVPPKFWKELIQKVSRSYYSHIDLTDGIDVQYVL